MGYQREDCALCGGHVARASDTTRYARVRVYGLAADVGNGWTKKHNKTLYVCGTCTEKNGWLNVHHKTAKEKKAE